MSSGTILLDTVIGRQTVIVAIFASGMVTYNGITIVLFTALIQKKPESIFCADCWKLNFLYMRSDQMKLRMFH